MTVLVAARLKGRTVIGCDTQITARGKKLNFENFSKITKINDDILIGFAGTHTAFHLLQKYIDHRTTPPADAQECFEYTKPFFNEYKEFMESRLTWTKANEDGVTLVVATKDKVFVVDEFSCEESTKYVAAGSGEDFALGSLHSCYPAKDCVDKALAAAVFYSEGCSKPVETWYIE